MLRVVACVTQQHDFRLVALAALLCLFACFTAFGLIARARQSPSARHRAMWTAVAAVVAGCGVWATHFVAMLAFRPGLPLAYDVTLTIASVVVAVSTIWVGLLLALRRAWRAAGGAVIGLAVGAMHFVGMSALLAPAELHYDPAYVAAALAIGVVLGAAASLAAGERVTLRPRALAGALLAAAICGLHFTAMAAVTLVPDPRFPPPEGVLLAPEWLALAVAAVAILIVALGLVGAIVDQHLAERAEEEAGRLRAHVAELEATRSQLERSATDLQAALAAASAASTAKSQFLANMGHELRTPLNAVIGFSELIAADHAVAADPARCREYAGDILRSGRRLLGLINDILDFSNLEAGRSGLQDDVVDLAGLARRAAATVEAQARSAGLSLTVEFDPAPLLVRADERRLRQALLNVLSNAVKFTPPGGSIRVGPLRSDAAVGISVRDSGVGIAPELVGKALEDFGQADGALNRKFEGAGLGLSISRRLMELHGGSIAIDSEGVGRGATVTLLLPARRLLSEGEREAA
jgi:signal transduction histidine kinase